MRVKKSLNILAVKLLCFVSVCLWLCVTVSAQSLQDVPQSQIQQMSQAQDSQQLFRLETYNPATATSEQQSLQNLLTSNSFIRIEKRIIESNDFNRIYKLRAFKPLWLVRGESGVMQFTPHFRQLHEAILQAWSHGLLVQDYWNKDLESYAQDIDNMNDQYWIATEFLITQAYLKYTDDLTNGRFNPDILDNDIRFVKKPFDDYAYLNEILFYEATRFKDLLYRLAPQHQSYQDLRELLIRLNYAKTNNLLPQFSTLPHDLKIGDTSTEVPKIRKRLNFLGYTLSSLDANVVDEELIQNLNQFQADNELRITSVISRGQTSLWSYLNIKVDNMILQTEINMEKLRWLPRLHEKNYIWVNTNSAEIRVYDNDQVIMNFKTINGQSLRRTPMMRDLLTGIVLNPTWTATDSIAIQDKLPELQKDIGYLQKSRMRVINKKTNAVVDASTIDWKNRGREAIRNNYLVMEPGPTNALGVMRFNLTLNNDAIYMHDTNDHSLFSSVERHFSSGCIRLEKPFELAAYALRNNPLYNLETLHAVTAKGVEGEVFERNKLVQLKKEDHIPVYLMPMTVERNVKGRFRFMADVYKQDERLGAALLSEGVRGENF